MEEKFNRNILVAIIVLLSIGLFGAWKWKINKNPEVDINDWQNWPQQIEPQIPNSPNLPPTQPENRPIPKPQSYQEAIDISKATGTTLFLFVGTDWCGYCKTMKAETLSDSKVTKELERYIVYLANGDKEKVKFKVNGYPTYFLIKDGSVIKQASGYKSSKDFLKWLAT